MATTTNLICDDCEKRLMEYASCDFCEGLFCERDFKLHDCAGHDPEIVLCVSCQAECEVSKGKLDGHETRPALIGGDPVCAKCAYFKPWESTARAEEFKKAV